LEPKVFTLPPTTAVGSIPACASRWAAIEVVVVFPCEPAMAMPYLSRISSASISARGMTGIFFARAATTSGLSLRTAVEITTTSASVRFSAAWPVKIRPPSEASRRVVSDSLTSEPETA
jgi:hypothetical protein